jgi:hypothetical protein
MKIMEAVAAHMVVLAEGRKAANVVALRGARRTRGH